MRDNKEPTGVPDSTAYFWAMKEHRYHFHRPDRLHKKGADGQPLCGKVTFYGQQLLDRTRSHWSKVTCKSCLCLREGALCDKGT
jgi:hypothetical protein